MADKRQTPWGGRRYMSMDEVAEYFGVSSRTIRRMITDRKLPAVRVGRQWRVPIAEVEALEKRESTQRWWD